MTEVDLNDWLLTYDTTALEFGTLRTGYPFTQQVELGTPDARLDDATHPSTDADLFGVDTSGGMTLTFAVAVPPMSARGVTPDPRVFHYLTGEIKSEWRNNLTLVDAFTVAWRARGLRKRAGAVAQLVNLERERVVYGRPRNLKPQLSRLRVGWVELLCDFKTSDDRFYDTDRQTLVLQPVPSSGNGIVFPVEWPALTVGTVSRTDTVTNRGSEPTWPTVTLTGPTTTPRVEVFDARGRRRWTLTLDGSLAFDETATIVTAPWARGVSINGSPGIGRLRGDPLDLCELPPGASPVLFTGTDATGTSRCTVTWQDAYATL